MTITPEKNPNKAGLRRLSALMYNQYGLIDLIGLMAIQQSMYAQQ